MKRLRKNSILVLGANGYIGRHVGKALSEKGYKYHLADKEHRSIDDDNNYSQIDILDQKSFLPLLSSYDFIFNFAGLTGTYAGFDDYEAFLKVNELGLLNLLNGVRKEKSPAKIIFPSSRLVYKGQKGRALKEEDDKEFRTVYAMNKFSCENYLKMYKECFGVDYTVFRICLVYGNLIDNSMSFGTLNQMVSVAEAGQNVTIFGDGRQKRSLIHVHDLVEIMIGAGLDSFTDDDVFNIGGPDVLSISEIASYLSNAYGVNVESIPWPPEHLAIESWDTIFDSSKLMKRIRYQYKYTFDSWINSSRK